jgi:hypothetical protein
VSYAGVFGQVEHSGERINWFANVSGILNGYKGIDYFQRKVLDLGDTILRIGALDTVQYNGQTYHAGSEGLEYFSTDWKYIPGVTIKGGLSYKESKEILIKNISAFIKPLREKREHIAMDEDNVLEILEQGGRRAREVAESKMNEVREKIGVKLY